MIDNLKTAKIIFANSVKALPATLNAIRFRLKRAQNLLNVFCYAKTDMLTY